MLNPLLYKCLMKTELVILHLSLIEGVGPETIKRVIESFKSNISDLYQVGYHDLVARGINGRQASLIVRGFESTDVLDKEIDLMERHDIKFIALNANEYPLLLKHIHSPPPILYYKGADFFTFEKNIAVVGSRKANSYGEQIIESWIPPLVQAGWSIVSGGALGADTMAHRAALAAHGKTVAILGSGLLSLYPRSNLSMFQKIIDCGGTLVSSFSLWTQPHPGHFPVRNRIISGLSSACLIVQAAKKSGAAITAECALEQGRMVFAIPGSVFDPLHEGCHAMIKEGATIIGSLDELMIELGEQPQSANEDEDGKSLEKELSLQIPLPLLTGQESLEQLIMHHCRKEVMSIDDLLCLIQVPLEELHDQLFNLQLTGKIEQNAAGLWRAR